MTPTIRCSEVKISKIAARQNSPQWQVDETERTKKGLLTLMHNVLLLQDATNPDAFTPVSPAIPSILSIHVASR